MAHGLPSRDERPHVGKSKPCKNEKAYKEWAARREFCACCGISRGGVWPQHSTHHVIKQGRSHDPCNLLFLCNRCHGLAEGEKIRDDGGKLYPQLTIGICLTLKMIREPDEWSPDRLRELRGKPLPDLEPVPMLFERLFRKRHPL